jgi:hypothetical protein
LDSILGLLKSFKNSGSGIRVTLKADPGIRVMLKADSGIRDSGSNSSWKSSTGFGKNHSGSTTLPPSIVHGRNSNKNVKTVIIHVRVQPEDDYK